MWTLNAQSRGPSVFPCETNVRKGAELGWFEHGSTIIMLAPEHFEFRRQCEGWRACSCRRGAVAETGGVSVQL